MTGLYDGLGNEELQVSGTNILAGSPVNYYMPGSLTASGLYSLQDISGTNIYAKTKLTTPTFSGTSIFAKTVVHTDTVRADTIFSGTAADITTISGVTFSGTNAYLKTGIYGSVISGANIYSTGNVIGEDVFGDTTVSGATVKGTAISGTGIVNNQGLLKSVAIGSPTGLFGASIQAGSGALSAGSVAWHVFPTAFTSVPIVQLTNATTVSSAVNVVVGSLAVGSFYAEGETASDEFTWTAIGL